MKRLKTLILLKKTILKNLPLIHLAICKDFGLKSEEGAIYETDLILKKLNKAIFSAKSVVKPEIFGTTLIISSEYSPFYNAIVPLIYAILRGDSVIMMPDSRSFYTAQAITQVVKSVIPSHMLSLISDNKDLRELIDTKISSVYYSGDKEKVKYIHMLAKSKDITCRFNIYKPKGLDIGKEKNKKSSLYDFVTEKFLFCGQYQDAPDYLLVSKNDKSLIISALRDLIEYHLGSDPLIDEDYGRIRNLSDYYRLIDIKKHYPSCYGGACCEKTLQIGPLVVEVPRDDAILKNKVFGPIIFLVTAD